MCAKRNVVKFPWKNDVKLTFICIFETRYISQLGYYAILFCVKSVKQCGVYLLRTKEFPYDTWRILYWSNRSVIDNTGKSRTYRFLSIGYGPLSIYLSLVLWGIIANMPLLWRWTKFNSLFMWNLIKQIVY